MGLNEGKVAEQTQTFLIKKKLKWWATLIKESLDAIYKMEEKMRNVALCFSTAQWLAHLPCKNKTWVSSVSNRGLNPAWILSGNASSTGVEDIYVSIYFNLCISVIVSWSFFLVWTFLAGLGNPWLLLLLLSSRVCNFLSAIINAQ